MPRQPGGSKPFSSASSSRSSRQKVNRKHKQRGLNAFAIATAETPEKLDLKKHRLGEAEPDNEPSNRKRRRSEDGSDDEDEDDDDEEEQPRRKQHKRGAEEDLDVSEGSDGEGNSWRLGHVAEGDDEEIDSDEAFDESDEERYEGFTFRGSTANQKKNKKTAKSKKSASMDLDENDEDAADDDDDESLGEDAVDLATMLDDEYASESVHSDDGDAGKGKGRAKAGSASASRSKMRHESPSEESSNDGEDSDAFGFSEEEDEGQNDAARLEQLRKVVSSLPQQGEEDDEDEPTTQSNRSRLLSALKGMSNLDPAFSRSFKKLAQGTEASATGDNDKLVKTPLPKRQQDRIDREAAYSRAKETLNRWIDTVKQNRRAEHLSFPLKDPDAQEPAGTTKLLQAGSDKPHNELEDAIQTILQESGLTQKGKKTGEDQIMEAEELKAKELPLAEVMARRAELRKQRELLFREEIRAKRIKKIKSKAYRRVHRKEKERAAEKERDLLLATGEYDSEEEREKNDRRRAEERMGARHRESKWAKGIKATGRAAWDEDARGGMVEMARRNEELRQRVEGRKVHNSDESSVESSESSDDDDEDDGGFRLRDALEKTETAPTTESKLGSMKFMQRADAARKRENDEAVAALRRELGEEGSDGSDQETTDAPVGRRTFGPSEHEQPLEPITRPQPAEFEEAPDSDDDDGAPLVRPGRDEDGAMTASQPTTLAIKPAQAQKLARPSKTEIRVAGKTDTSSGTPKTNFASLNGAVPAKAANKISTSKVAKGNRDANDNDTDHALVPSSLALVQAAFGGDDVEADFAKEKAEAANVEDDQFVDDSLPGWGSWTGDGIKPSKRGVQQPKRLKKVQSGTKAVNRADAKLDRVIISEKRVKKNAKYLAPQLPHPFESRQQYERSLRVPVGPEWTTKETFQRATKPRVMVKQGIIRPLDKPLV